MSSDSTVQALEVTDSGFTIAKQISRKGGEHIQVDLEITSTHDKQATVDLVEQIPPGTDHSQIGFLPDNEPTEWDVSEDGRLMLQTRLVAQGTGQIVYGIKDIENTDVETLATETRIVGVGGPAGEDVEVDADPVGAATADETAETAADSDPAPADEPAGTVAEEDTPETVADGAAEPASPAAIEGQLDDETAEQLAAQLAPHMEDHIELDAVTETKIAQLQEDVSDIRAYLPAFEEFLGDAGRAEDILDELEALRAEVDEMDDAPEELEETIATMDDRMASIEDTVDEFDDQLVEVLDRLESLETWREDIATASQ